MKTLHALALFCALMLPSLAHAEKKAAAKPAAKTLAPALPDVKRILILGDSITHDGKYVEYLETVLTVNTEKHYDILDLGLSSETVSGLSEEGHANGKFPRPDLHERLDRVLATTKPELIVACYGMNCGIYLPLDDDRFQKYKDGIQYLRDKAKAVGATVIHVTPPTFEPGPTKKTPYYNDVLGAYGKWLLAQREKGWKVIDIHTPMEAYIKAKLKDDPKFMLAKDGIHPGEAGHWIMAQQILKYWGVKHDFTLEDFTDKMGRMRALHDLVKQRLHTRSAAYLSAAGHKRPGVAAGLPLEKAEALGAELTQRIESMKHGNPNEPAQPMEEVKKAAPTTTEAAPFPGTKADWHGFDSYTFEVNGKPLTIVVPKEAAKGKPWCWHGEFFGHKPDPDIALLGKGFHIAYAKINDMLGCPDAVKHWNAVYAELTKKYGFGKKPALVGLSRGGLYCYNWAIANPTKVSCIYGDAPVCDFKSWPGGKGKGKGDKHNWELVLSLWNFKDEAEALAYKGNPVDSLAPLAKNKVPLLHVYGDVDDVVPADENTLIMAERYRKMGGTMELIAKAGVGHHPHGLQDSTPIINFIAKHAGN
jgi:lysophospholipase L1-like esterase/pimeloyl-ACP methyl ester carboxylesterase